MAAADLVLTPALIAALGWALIHFLWQGCVIAGLFWLVCVLSSRENAHLRYWAGICGFFLSLAAVLITFVVYYKPEARFVATSVHSEAINPFLVLAGAWPDTRSLLHQGLEPVLPLIVLLWLAGVLIHSAQAVYGWVGIRRLVRSGTADIGTSLRSVIGDLQQLLGVHGQVRVLQSALVKVPMAAGWLKPVILLPASVLVQLPRDQLEMIIAHELGHIRRYDHLFNLFQILVETLLFYHPAIAWMSNRVRHERETCCDDLVVSRCNRPAAYARALANLEGMRSHADTLALAATGGDLLGRIKRIIDRELPRSRSGYVQISFLLLITALVGFGAHQGMLLSHALNQVAGSVRLQSSDVEWKTWGTARAAWASGIQNYADLAVAAASAVQSSQPPLEPQLVPPPPTPLATPLVTMGSLAQTGMAAAGIQVEAKSTPVAQSEIAWEVSQPAKEQVTSSTVAVLPKPAKAVPTPLLTTAPKYPWQARAKDVEGFVELAFSLDSEGRVVDIEVLDSLPAGVFERAATKALKQWKFSATGVSGKPQRLVQKFDFALAQGTVQQPLARNCASAGHRACKRIPANAVVVYVNPPGGAEPPAKGN